MKGLNTFWRFYTEPDVCWQPSCLHLIKAQIWQSRAEYPENRVRVWKLNQNQVFWSNPAHHSRPLWSGPRRSWKEQRNGGSDVKIHFSPETEELLCRRAEPEPIHVGSMKMLGLLHLWGSLHLERLKVTARTSCNRKLTENNSYLPGFIQTTQERQRKMKYDIKRWNWLFQEHFFSCNFVAAVALCCRQLVTTGTTRYFTSAVFLQTWRSMLNICI